MKGDEFSAAFQANFQTVFMRCHRRISTEAVRPTPQTMAALVHLSTIGPATVQELANHFGRAQSTVTEMVDRFQHNGLVARMPDERDRRRIFIWLTDEGKNRLQEAMTPLDPARIMKMADRLSEDEKTEFLRLFSKLTRRDAETQTRAYMKSTPAWAKHPALQ